MTPKEFIDYLRNHPEFWDDFEALLIVHSANISKKEASDNI